MTRVLINILSKLKKEAKSIDDDFFRERTKSYAEDIQDRLIDGLVKSYDIEGRPFTPLAKSTMAIRKRRQMSSSRPLQESGGILKFLMSDDLISSAISQVRLNEPPEKYMETQNTQFEIPVSKFSEKYNTVGKSVSYTGRARKWHGIPKTYRKGGTKYDLFLKKIDREIKERLEKAFK